MRTIKNMQIGNLLVEAGIISPITLERSLEGQKGSGKRLGTMLREMGIVTEEEVLHALAKQCNLRIAKNFTQQTFPKELLDLVPARLALEMIVFPLKAYQKMLALATVDPFDRETFGLIEEKNGMKIHPVLATKDDIIAAIRRHYPVGRWAVGGKRNIVMIEPSPVTAGFLRAPLEKEGYKVSVCHDGIEGMKMIYSCRPDLVICEQMMPRMDSNLFLHALKTHPSTMNIPVIIMTSRWSADEEHRARKAGFFDILVKPVMSVRVLACVKKALALADGLTLTTESGTPRHAAHLSMPPHSIRKMFRSRH